VTEEARSLGIGGSIKWASLPSANARFSLVLAAETFAGDYPVSGPNRGAIDAIDFATAMPCIDAALWP
jgi:hypothetical protein